MTYPERVQQVFYSFLKDQQKRKCRNYVDVKYLGSPQKYTSIIPCTELKLTKDVRLYKELQMKLLIKRMGTLEYKLQHT